MIKFLLILLFPLSLSAQILTNASNGQVVSPGTNFSNVIIASGGGAFTYTVVTNAMAFGTGTAIVGPIDTTGGNLIALNADWFSAANAFGDNKGNTYTPGNTYGSSGGNYSNQWVYCVSPTVGAGHYFTNTANVTVFNVVVLKKSSGTPAVDAQSGFNHTSGNISTMQPGSITPFGDNEAMLTAFSCNDNGGGSATNAVIDSGFTILGQTKEGANLLYGGSAILIQTTGAAVNPTWTFAHQINAGSASIIWFK